MGTERITIGLSFEEKLRLSLTTELEQDGGSPSHFLELLARAVEEMIWLELGFESFAQFIEAEKPEGLGSNKQNIKTILQLQHRDETTDSIIRERMDDLRIKAKQFLYENEINQPKLGNKAAGRPPKGEEKPDNYQAFYGTDKEYIIARLANDHPDILEDLERGKYRSARQAGIAAGFIKDVKRIQVLPDPQKIAPKLKERLTPAQIKELIQLLQEEPETQ